MIKLIGLTGGIGCGKSQAAAFFQEEGVPVIGMDAVGHELLQHDTAIKDAIVGMFGSGILDGERPSREKIGRLVFQDQEALKKLNALLHPAIAQETVRRARALEQDGHGVVLIEAALFAEDYEKESWLDGLILISAPEALRIERLQKSRSMSLPEIRQRMAQQADPEKKRPLADRVIHNDKSQEDLRRQVQEAARELLCRFPRRKS